MLTPWRLLLRRHGLNVLRTAGWRTTNQQSGASRDFGGQTLSCTTRRSPLRRPASCPGCLSEDRGSAVGIHGPMSRSQQTTVVFSAWCAARALSSPWCMSSSIVRRTRLPGSGMDSQVSWRQAVPESSHCIAIDGVGGSFVAYAGACAISGPCALEQQVCGRPGSPSAWISKPTNSGSKIWFFGSEVW